MTKNDKILSAAVIGAIVILATFLIFFLTNPQKTSLEGISFLFILISEIILFAVIIFMVSKRLKSNKAVIQIGIIFTLSIYFIITVMISLLRHVFKNNINGFILTNILIIAITAVICVLLFVVSLKISATDQKIKNARVNMELLEKHVFELSVNKQYSEYEQPLNQIYESIKFTDKTSASLIDPKLNHSIDTLEDMLINNDGNIGDIIDEIMSLLKQRNMELLNEKRGGF